VPSIPRSRIARLAAAAGLVALTASSLAIGSASAQRSLDDIKSRMNEIQADLNALQSSIEDLRTQEDELLQDLSSIELRQRELTSKKVKLQGRVVRAANVLYKAGQTDMLELLMTAESLTELTTRAEVLSEISQRDNAAVIEFTRTQEELDRLTAELSAKKDRLAETRARLADETDRLQAAFADASDDYDDLLAEIRARQAAERAAAQAPAPPIASAPVLPRPKGDMTCPVAGPHSFVDSWGAPRSGGRRHEGTDIMANYGTPVVAIVSGTITFAGYGGSAGNWQILSGSDGNSYWYMHNQRNIVTGGHVSVGQQIAEVGDTGNATGIPHLHFEYHPGGGGPVNPYPLLVGIC
jgi:murein DD-endopeptidase MepM/ murein hydrolase activator NlpD